MFQVKCKYHEEFFEALAFVVHEISTHGLKQFSALGIVLTLNNLKQEQAIKVGYPAVLS